MSAIPARAIARKHDGIVPTDVVDVGALASVEVTSEEDLYPVDHLFDGRNGAGGSCWVASKPGAQVIILRFSRPLAVLGTVIIESEERSDTRAQTIELSGWSEETQRPFVAASHRLEYSPYGKSFHILSWELDAREVTHLRVRVVPEKNRGRASLTAIVLRRGEP